MSDESGTSTGQTGRRTKVSVTIPALALEAAQRYIAASTRGENITVSSLVTAGLIAELRRRGVELDVVESSVSSSVSPPGGGDVDG